MMQRKYTLRSYRSKFREKCPYLGWCWCHRYQTLYHRHISSLDFWSTFSSVDS